jgi:hypothetical protein
VGTFARRLAVVAAILTLCVGNVELCPGWRATPEARMACCMSGTTCPIHKSEGHDHLARRTVSQAQADSCCAAATQQRDSAAARSTIASAGASALLPVEPVAGMAAATAPQHRPALVPLPVSSVPKHLLLSVLLL